MNVDDKSWDLYLKEHEARLQFEYFMCTLAGGLFAYIGQTYVPQKLNTFYNDLTPCALYCLAVCVAFGLWLIKYIGKATTLNKQYMHLCEENKLLNERLHTENPKNGFIMLTTGHTFTADEVKQMIDKNREGINSTLAEVLKVMNASGKMEATRNVAFAAGFFLILASKMLQPYFAAK